MTLSMPRLGPVGVVASPPVSIIRPFDRDLRAVSQILGADSDVADALVFYPSATATGDAWREMRQAARDRNVPVIIDTLGVELDSIGTRGQYLAKVPWGDALVTADDDEAVDLMVSTVAETQVDAVVVPAPVILAEVRSISLLDRRVTLLRERLDEAGLNHVKLHYPLVGRLADLDRQLPELVRRLPGLPIDSVWLRVHRMGAEASVKAIRNYIRLARALHTARLPLVGDRTGVFGVGLAAFGAIAAVSSGLTMGDRTDVQSMCRPPRPKRPSDKPFMPAPRIYLSELGLYLTRREAAAFFGIRGHKTRYGCSDVCCSTSVDAMLARPRRHFLRQRYVEVHRWDAIPIHLRADQWVDRWLRPASDHSHRLSRRSGLYGNHLARVGAWRDACTAQLEADEKVGSIPVSAPLSLHASEMRPSSAVSRR